MHQLALTIFLLILTISSNTHAMKRQAPSTETEESASKLIRKARIQAEQEVISPVTLNSDVLSLVMFELSLKDLHSLILTCRDWQKATELRFKDYVTFRNSFSKLTSTYMQDYHDPDHQDHRLKMEDACYLVDKLRAMHKNFPHPKEEKIFLAKNFIKHNAEKIEKAVNLSTLAKKPWLCEALVNRSEEEKSLCSLIENDISIFVILATLRVYYEDLRLVEEAVLDNYNEPEILLLLAPSMVLLARFELAIKDRDKNSDSIIFAYETCSRKDGNPLFVLTTAREFCDAGNIEFAGQLFEAASAHFSEYLFFCMKAFVCYCELKDHSRVISTAKILDESGNLNGPHLLMAAKSYAVARKFDVARNLLDRAESEDFPRSKSLLEVIRAVKTLLDNQDNASTSL